MCNTESVGTVQLTRLPFEGLLCRTVEFPQRMQLNTIDSEFEGRLYIESVLVLKNHFWKLTRSDPEGLQHRIDLFS